MQLGNDGPFAITHHFAVGERPRVIHMEHAAPDIAPEIIRVIDMEDVEELRPFKLLIAQEGFRERIAANAEVEHVETVIGVAEVQQEVQWLGEREWSRHEDVFGEGVAKETNVHRRPQVRVGEVTVLPKREVVVMHGMLLSGIGMRDQGAVVGQADRNWNIARGEGKRGFREVCVLGVKQAQPQFANQ